MQNFGFSDSVLDVAKAVLNKNKPEELEAKELKEAKLPRQLKDPKKEKRNSKVGNLLKSILESDDDTKTIKNIKEIKLLLHNKRKLPMEGNKA